MPNAPDHEAHCRLARDIEINRCEREKNRLAERNVYVGPRARLLYEAWLESMRAQFTAQATQEWDDANRDEWSFEECAELVTRERYPQPEFRAARIAELKALLASEDS
jgi:hypothetical protein